MRTRITNYIRSGHAGLCLISHEEARVEAEGLERAFADLLFDPQTSGGLLISMDPADADAFEAALKEKAPLARRVGFVREASLGKIAVLA